jgi:dihydrofolate reductase
LGLPFAQKIELTRVHGTFDADAFFLKIDPLEWKLVHEEFHSKDEKHNFDFTFQTFLRKELV